MKRYGILMCMLATTVTHSALAASTSEPTTIEFKFTPHPGQVIKQRIVTKSVGTMKLAAPMPPMRFVQSFEQEIAAECKQVNPDRSSVFDMTFSIVTAKMNASGMNLEYVAKSFDPSQVDDPVSRWIGQFYSAFSDSKVTAIFQPDGKLDKIVGMCEAVDHVMTQLKAKVGKDKTSASLMKFVDKMCTMFDDDTMTEQMQAYNRMVPDKKGPVRIGEKWDRQWNMTLPVFNANCQAKGEYQLIGIEQLQGRPCAKIRLKETFRMATDPNRHKSGEVGASQPFGGFLDQLNFTLVSSGGEGIAYWDYEAGVLVRLRQTQRMTMEFKLKSSEGETPASAPAGFGPMTQEFQTSIAVDLIDNQASVSTQPQKQ